MTPDPFTCEHLEPRTLLSSPDPITDDHPLWAVPRGAATIDGVLDGDEWSNAFSTTRSLAYNENVVATVSMMYDDEGIYMAARVLDQFLWSDGTGQGQGERYQIEQDDAIIFYFDQDRSQDIYLQDEDRGFGWSIGNWTDPKNTDDDGPVRRYKLVKGDGAGGAPNAGWFQEDFETYGGDSEDFFVPWGTTYATTYQGTLNDDSDIDTGWTTEGFLPWSALGMSAPSHGQTIGMNFDIILDDTGGTRDTVNRRHTDERWEGVFVPDDHLTGSHSSYNSGQPGVNGPVGYAEVMFVNSATGAAVPSIADLSADVVTGYSAHLGFTAPAATASGDGFVSAYEIRYAPTPISTTAAWLDATVFENRYLPRGAGLEESLRLIGLTPNTTYHVAIRPVDAVGNAGAFTSTQFTTLTTAQDTSEGLRVVPSPMGRLLMTEAGDPYFAVGDHMGISWAYTRQLFPGDVWDSVNNVYQNFYDNEPIEGPVDAFFDDLEARGVNMMRVFIEQPGSPAAPDLPDDPRGSYWLEHDVGVYNDDMREFLNNVLDEAEARGIYVVLSAFSTYYYRTGFGLDGPWATEFGGPLTTIDDFFQEPQTLEIAKDRMTEVIGWVQDHPAAHRVIGYELINEWHAKRWSSNAEGDTTPDRAPEVIRRAQWLSELAQHVKQLDPTRLVINPPVLEEIRGAIARATLYSRDYDMVMPHLYTMSNEEAIYNPSSDRAVGAAVEQGRVTSSWLLQTDDRRPILNGEWGSVRHLWPSGETYYSDQTYTWGTPDASPSFTLADDIGIYSGVIWSGIATGQAGTPLRMGNANMDYITGYNENDRALKQGYILPDGMRDTQELVSRWVETTVIGFDWTTYSPDPLSGLVSAASESGHTLHAMGSSDGSQGIVYVQQDRDARDGTVSDAVVTLAGLNLDTLYDLEIWSTQTGGTEAQTVLRGVFSNDGTITFSLPEFNGSIVVRFSGERTVQQTEQVAAIQVGPRTVTFSIDLDGHPIATLFDARDQTTQTVDVAGLVGFTGRAVDISPYLTSNGIVHLALTDDDHNLWVINGNVDTGTWWARNLTAGIDAAGIAGDLTVYLPSWGSIHIGGIDARGHAINYWWAPGLDDWAFADLTTQLDGPTMSGGLTSWVAPWGALNLAGLNDTGEIVVYWWVPGMARWANLNMTTQFEGPSLAGQLTAFVTPWGAMNIVGLNDQGNAVAYWWVPGANWLVSDLTTITDTSSFNQGLSTALSTDGGINLFGLDDAGDLVVLRWTPGTGWNDTNVTQASGADQVSFPVGAASSQGYMTVMGERTGSDRSLLLHVLDLNADMWTLNTAQ